MPARPYTEPLTFEDMERFLAAGWGGKGRRAARTWLDFNRRYFGGALRPIPLIFTHAQPFGRRAGMTCCGERDGRLIALAAPAHGDRLVADRGILLHEQIHQFLGENSEDRHHNSEPWCREIMRLHKMITGEQIWAAPELVRKTPAGAHSGNRRSIRIHKPDPESGRASLSRREIARWPHSLGVNLGAL